MANEFLTLNVETKETVYGHCSMTPLHLKKLKRWCEAGGSVCVTEMLASSSTVPPSALTISLALAVSNGVDNEEGITERESENRTFYTQYVIRLVKELWVHCDRLETERS